MRALRFHGNKDIRVDSIPVPPLRSRWVKVKNVWSGICGSDLHEYLIGPKNASTEPHSLTGETLPSVLGHEFAGTIEEVGDGVTDLDIGQKVAVFPVITDGTCYWCQQEVLGQCDKWGFMGYSGWGGGMAEYICVERQAIHKIPDHVPLDVAALVEPIAVGWHGVRLAKMQAGQTALVTGAGPIGIAVVLSLVAHGCKSIIVSEPSPARAAQARAAGATHVFNPIKEDIPKKCYELCEGKGVHAVFECAGVQAAMDASIESVRGKGVVINIAVFETPVTINANMVNRKSLSYIGSNIYTRGEFQEVIDAIASGKIEHPEKMITAKVPLENSVSAFEALLAQKDKHVKVLIKSS